ncbi:FAD-binding oxidoreductase [Chloroflexota bacterium]
MKPEYGEVTGQTIEELAVLVGRGNIYTDKSDMEAYSRDESPLTESYSPQVVVKPRDAASVAKLMAFASEKRIPVTPRGAGTGLSGGCVPVYGGILLSMERMKPILEIDSDNFTATVEPGVTLADLTAEVELKGLYYPLHPGEMTATIGGNECR